MEIPLNSLPLSSGSLSHFKEQSLLIMTDPATDPDDEAMATLVAGLKRVGAPINLLGMAVCKAPSDRRAVLLDGQYQTMGLPHTPVAVGSNLNLSGKTAAYELSAEYLGQGHAHELSAVDQMHAALRSRKDGSVTMLVVAGMADLAALIQLDPELVVRKVCRFAIMGGVEADRQDPTVPALDRRGFLIPEDGAANHDFDIPASHLVFDFAQQVGIQLVVLTRFAALAAPVDKRFYDYLADTGHEVGKRLQSMQNAALQSLWERTHTGEGLPPRCNPQWFIDRFLGGNGEGLTAETKIWDRLVGKGFALYDPMTAIAATDELRDEFMEATSVTVNGGGFASHLAWSAAQPARWMSELSDQITASCRAEASGDSATQATAQKRIRQLQAKYVPGASYLAQRYSRLEVPPSGRLSEARTTNHLVVGVSATNTGIKNPDDLSAFMLRGALKALTKTSS